MLKRFGNWVVHILGFRKNDEYVKTYFNEANIRSSIYMSWVIIILEIWMIIRYITKYMMAPGSEVTMADFWNYTKNFWLLLSVGIIMLAYAFYYLRSKRRNQLVSVCFIVAFAAICVYFGIIVSFNDFMSGKQILCFVTMVMFAACLLIWKPYVSILMLAGIFGYFYKLLENHSGLEIRSGDQVNYITLFISLTMVCISIYHQRMREAVKDEELERIAVEDDLTKVNNMRHFTTEAKAILEDPETDISRKLFLYLNIENFKIYNDQRGFVEGNEFLKADGMMLLEEFSDSLVARQSDDHFVVLTDEDGFYEKIERVQNRLREFEREIYIPLKVGGYKPRSRDVDIRRCVDRARYACSLLKNKSDELYFEYNQQTHEYFQKRTYVINHLDEAVEKGYIKVFYQPVVWSQDWKLCGCEALARWIDPEHGFLSPGDFIPILEECRLIHKLDACIYEIVCRDLREIMDKGGTPVPISLNFSRLDFELMDAVGTMDALIQKYRIPKHLVHVEVTESALTNNLQILKEATEDFGEKGYELWLDDFGSGYSSLNTLKDFQFDVLKIDMQFLVNFENNPKTKDILASIVDLANKLGMKTLAEGVETQEQADYLKSIGCGRLQGYFFGKPMEFGELKQSIADGKYVISDNVSVN